LPWKRLTVKNGRIVYEPLIQSLKVNKPNPVFIQDPTGGWKKIVLDPDLGNVYAIISCRVGLVGGTATTYTIIANSDMLLNIDDFPAEAKGRIRVNWKNAGTATQTLYVMLYKQYPSPATPIANSEVKQTLGAGVWDVTEGSLFSLPSGLNSFQIAYKISAQSMDISKVELQIEKG